MKYLNKFLLFSFLSFNLIQSSENNSETPEKEYDQCMKKAEDLLIQEAQTKSFHGFGSWRNYKSGAGSIGHGDKFIQSRYNHQCNRCLVGYALKTILNFLKKR